MKTSNRAVLCALGCVAGLGTMSAKADAGIIPVLGDGEYQLGNHPDAVNAEPNYGLVLHNLYTDITGSRTFTFDFEHELSDVRMIVDSQAESIRIFGPVFGGRDIGEEWAADTRRGVYQLDFTFDSGVALAGGDDDYEVLQPAQNDGRLIAPNGDTFQLFDMENDGQNFRLGNEDNDLGHRGFDGVSGWGWLRGNQIFERTEMVTGDFIFTVVPAPGSVMLGGLGLACFGGRRRRDEA